MGVIRNIRISRRSKVLVGFLGLVSVPVVMVNPSKAADSGTLVIAPHLAGEYFCDDAVKNPKIKNDDDAARYCAARGQTAADRIAAALDKIGPVTSPSGEYRLGYMLTIPLMRYYRRDGDGWTFDEEALTENLKTITEVNRPVVIYLSANHFTDTYNPITVELLKDKRNLMWDRDGVMGGKSYFGHPITAWSLNDYTAPVNERRKEALKDVIAGICQLPKASRDKIVAISLFGEVSQVFPGMENGPGYNIPMYDTTDYSPIAVRGFRYWLSQKYGSVAKLNHDLGADFKSFDEVEPPSKDIHAEKLSSFFQHIDQFAAGQVAIYGWLYDKEMRRLDVSIFVDGKKVGNAQTGLSRTDVTTAVPSMKTPNVGFRYDLDFRQMAYGIHTLDVVVDVGAEHLTLAHQSLVVVDRFQDPSKKIRSQKVDAKPLSTDKNVMGHLDGPTGLQSVFYNPLAQLWLEYRNLVVRNYLETYARMFAGSCIPESMIFSHEVIPELYGSWNKDALAVDAALRPSAEYNPGVTLYGGAAFGKAFFREKKALGWTRYGVGEMHPIVKMSPTQYREMFERHRENGAVYVAPYYMSIMPQTFPGDGGLGQFLISPENKTNSSNLYYESIRSIMRR